MNTAGNVHSPIERVWVMFYLQTVLILFLFELMLAVFTSYYLNCLNSTIVNEEDIISVQFIGPCCSSDATYIVNLCMFGLA